MLLHLLSNTGRSCIIAYTSLTITSHRFPVAWKEKIWSFNLADVNEGHTAIVWVGEQESGQCRTAQCPRVGRDSSGCRVPGPSLATLSLTDTASR